MSNKLGVIEYKNQFKSKFLVALIALVFAGGLVFSIANTAVAAPVASVEVTAPTNIAPTATGDHKPLPLCKKGAYNPDGSKRSHQDYALCMAAVLDQALALYDQKKYEEALKKISEAYFGWYENQLEPPSMTLPGNRKIKMEGRFTRLKLAIRANPEAKHIPDDLRLIQVAVARDAMVLDGVLPKDSPESAGAQLLQQKTEHKKADASTLNWVDFITAMTLLLREGLEALLVVAAIVLYLVKAGYKQLVKGVYLGALAAIILSFVLAWIMQLATGGASSASELLEGATMFLAVAMLFYVSNWMLSKTSGENWSRYIKGMVESSVSSGTAKALIFAAFLAVIREGAELVLFYTASFSGGDHNSWWIAAGFLTGVVCLVVIWLIFRYGGAKLPVRPIFKGTSILLFIMCISFVGKGVAELREAGLILGETNLPWMKYYLPELGIFPQAETLLPQLILLIAAIWIIWANVAATRRYNKEQKKIAAAQASAGETAEIA